MRGDLTGDKSAKNLQTKPVPVKPKDFDFFEDATEI